MKISDFILKNISAHPSDIVKLSMKEFGITRPAVHKHLKKLIEEKKILAKGGTKSRIYLLTEEAPIYFKIDVKKGLDESKVWEEHLEVFAHKLPKNVYSICYYGFTEMVNNVIDHSGATKLLVEFQMSKDKIRFLIHDNGIGIFEKIKKTLHLKNYHEALLHLTKGKFTTDPTKHTGEGIFFTSRAFDQFHLVANQVKYSRYDDENDWLVNTSEKTKGTLVEMEIEKESPKILKRIFDKYAPVKDDYSFNKTEVLVALGLNPDEHYISRSQAKRILLGLDKFKHIILDFKRVQTVGQGFVDEVFRVFQNEHPDIKITSRNENKDVDFMIRRGR